MLESSNSPKEIVSKMISNDAFSKWLGIKVVEVKKGYCKLEMHVRNEMTNGFSIAHGGISYSLADSALAFSSNSHGKQSLSIETSISHTQTAKVGDVLIATTEELSYTEKMGLYIIKISNQYNKEIAYFKGTVYRTSKDWLIDNE